MINALAEDNNTILSKVKLPKATMLKNSTVSYLDEPIEVDSFGELFSEGKFYGRLRSNSFYFRWNALDDSHDNTFITGVGGSVVYQSAIYNGFGFGAGLYYSHGFFNESIDSALSFKAGKDAFSRYSYLKTGNKNMAVLGQAYLQYAWWNDTSLKLGRQLVESFYTKSNDTKMIPNTFDGLVFKTEDIPDSTLQLAYLARQKLRDHVEAHAILMRGDCQSDGCYDSLTDPKEITAQEKIASLSENDDSAMHKGLTYSNLKAAGKPTDAPLITGDLHTSVASYSLDLDASFYVVPELLAQVMLEGNYEFNIGDVRIIPGVRYIKQFDNGAGAVGGASLSGDLNSTYTKSYSNYDSLESQMVAARLVFKLDKYKLNLGYTYILDEADLVTPWRGFPTSGYTRSMGRYNWKANTKSYRLEFVRCTSTDGIYNDVFVQTSVLYQDNDPDKTGLQHDNSLYYYLGLMQNLSYLDNMQWRFRIGYQQFLNTDTKKTQFNGISFSDDDLNNLDTRFEINYFF
jgi:hypothetical protein